jgi:hypothetical protein
MRARTFFSSALAGSLLTVSLSFAPLGVHAGAPDTNPTAAKHIPGKPQAPVDIRYRFDGEPAVGETTSVTVFVTPLVDNESLSAKYRAKGDLGLSRGGSAWGVDELGRDSLIYTLEITPGSNGPAVVQVMATIQITGTQQNRIMSIPIRLGAAEIEPVATYSGKVSVDASGEAVVSMPARTEIIPVESE